MRFKKILQRSSQDQHYISPPILIDPPRYHTQPVYRIKANGAHVLQQPQRGRPTSVPFDVNLDEYEPTWQDTSYPRPVWASTDHLGKHNDKKQSMYIIEPRLMQQPRVTAPCMGSELLPHWLAQDRNHDQQLQLLFEDINRLSVQQFECAQRHRQLMQRHQQLQGQLHQKNLHIAKLKQELGR